MPCYHPFHTYNSYGELCTIGCGRCIGCKLEKSRQWSVRITNEASLYRENCFITLTYNDENLPADGSLCKAHFQDFMKRLRYYNKHKKIRFYACGEYGDKLGRPHYHACLLNHDFHDKQTLYKSYNPKNHFSSSEPYELWFSPELEKIWGKGFGTVGEVNEKSAGYAARYCTKKINGKKADKHYKGKTPEFSLMSRMPGIGRPWIEKYYTDFYPKDFTTINGVKHKPPLYYDKYLMQKDFALYEEIKHYRKEAALKEDQKIHDNWIKGKGQCKEKVKLRKEKYKSIITKTLQRSFENES